MTSISKTGAIFLFCVICVSPLIVIRPFVSAENNLYYHEINEFSHIRGDYRGASVQTCHVKGHTDCSITKQLEYPQESIYILWTNYLSPAVYIVLVVYVLVRSDGQRSASYLIIILETVLFINAMRFATVVGSAVGFRTSDLTAMFVCFTVFSGMFPLTALVVGIVKATSLHKRCQFNVQFRSNRFQHRSKRASSLVRERYVKTDFTDIELALEESTIDSTIRTHPLNTNINEEMQALLEPLWKEHAHLIGNGKDARGLGHTMFNVQNVRHVNNGHVLRLYSCRRNTIKRFATSVGGKLKGIDEYQLMPTSKPVPTIHSPSVETNYIDKTINEYYLFHGTSANNADSIAKQGFDRNYCKRTMIGQGIYFSDSFVKADQYTKPDENEHCCVILARVLLGDFVVAKDASAIPSISQQPPCKKCMMEKCHGKHKKKTLRFDSVVYTGGLFREFVVYDNWQAYPEYIIYYKRV